MEGAGQGIRASRGVQEGGQGNCQGLEAGLLGSSDPGAGPGMLGFPGTFKAEWAFPELKE